MGSTIRTSCLFRMYNYYIRDCGKVQVSYENNLWQSQVENEHYTTLSGLIQLVLSLECLIEITPDFLCPFMND